MTVNGVSREIDPGQGTAPVLVDGRVFVPIRSIVEAMGGTISWTGAEQKLTINLGTTVIDLWIGRTTAKVNGVTKTLDVSPYISDTGRTMLPLRFVTENLGCQVQWEGATQKVTITYGGNGASVPGPSSTNSPATQPTTTAPSGVTSSGPFTGIWDVTYDNEKGYMYLVQDGSQVSGNRDDGDVITGTVTGKVFVGKYYAGSNPNVTNDVTMTLSADGQSFDGSYHYSMWDYAFHGVKNKTAMAKITATPTPGAPAANFAGAWANFGADIVLTQSGSQVSGTWGDNTMSGTVTGNILNGRFCRTSCPTLFWDYNLTMSADGKSFTGWYTWKGGYTFTGTKK